MLATEVCGGCGGDLLEGIVKFTCVLCHVTGIQEYEGGINHKKCGQNNVD